jgi:hypothetical protein
VSATWSWRQHHDSDRCATVFIISFVSPVLPSLCHVADIVSWRMPVCGPPNGVHDLDSADSSSHEWMNEWMNERRAGVNQPMRYDRQFLFTYLQNKTSVMDVIGFLCVSQGSRRACACSEPGFDSQNGDRAWGFYYRRAAFCCAFFVGKGLNVKDIHKEMFAIYVEKCLSRKVVHNWVEKFSQGRSKVADDARPGAEVVGTTLKRLLCCGFRRTGKAMGQEYQCWWRICREINVFQVRISHVLRFTSICDLFTDSPSYYTCIWQVTGWTMNPKRFERKR